MSTATARMTKRSSDRYGGTKEPRSYIDAMAKKVPTPSWWSCSLRLVCLVEGTGLIDEWRNVYVFRAKSEDAALTRALELGRAEEETYLNVDGERVRWALRQIDTLDLLEEGRLGDREVWFETLAPKEPDSSVPFDIEYKPEDSKPKMTGV